MPTPTESAIEDIREAERHLARARADEAGAEHELEEAITELEEAEHRKGMWVIVNGRRPEVHGQRLSFEAVVKLAFPDAPSGENIIYTVAYRNGGNEHRSEGTMVPGESIKIKDGTIFDVTATDKS